MNKTKIKEKYTYTDRKIGKSTSGGERENTIMRVVHDKVADHQLVLDTGQVHFLALHAIAVS